jgi:hypothetical protein
MTGAELISEAISYYDNTLATDATNVNRRLRILHSAQLVLDEIYNFKNWPFKNSNINVEVYEGAAYLPYFPAGVPVPPMDPTGYFYPGSFGRLASEGAVQDASSKAFYTETTLQEIVALRASGDSHRKLFALGSETARGTQPTVVPSISSWSSVTKKWTGGFHKLLIPDTTAVGPTLAVAFDMAPPKLADDANEITALPYQYQRTVLLAGTIVRMQTAKSDTRQYWEAQYALGIGRMAVNEMPLQSRVVQLPLFQRGQW